MRGWSAGAAIAVALLVASSADVAAQGPIGSQTLFAGAYRLRVDLYSDPPFAGRRFDFDVLVSADRGAELHDLSLQATAIPDRSTNATRLPVLLSAAGGGYKGFTTMPVRGGWRLVFTVAGPLGTNTVSLPLEVAAPVAIPISLAWTIALSPLLLLLAFLLQQRRYLGRLQRAAAFH
jgi:hypothetical protein